MMEKMIALQQKRRSKKGGFTLVELIVVLVILAILAALLIPALTGYIDKARDKQIVAECRQVVMAAQTLYDEAYGSGTTTKVSQTQSKDSMLGAGSKEGITPADKILELAELKDKGTIEDITVAEGKIATLTWSKTGITKKCYYINGTYEVK